MIYAERFRFSSESGVQVVDFSAAHLSEQPKAVLAPGVPVLKHLYPALTRLCLEVPALTRLCLEVPALTRLCLATTALTRLWLLPARDARKRFGQRPNRDASEER